MTYETSKRALTTALELQLHDADLKSDLSSLSLNKGINRRDFLGQLGAITLASVSTLNSSNPSQSISKSHRINIPYYSLGDYTCTAGCSENEIDIPYYRQQEDYYCGVASTRMVLGHLLYPQEPPSQKQLAYEMSTDTLKGTMVSSIVTAFWTRGYTDVKADGDLSIDKLKEFICNDTPVIADGGFIQPSHYVVVIGYDERDSKMIVHDPTKGPAIQYDYSLFDNFWTSAENNPGERMGIIVPYKPSINIRNVLQGNIPKILRDHTQEILFGILSLEIPLLYALAKISKRKHQMKEIS